MYAQDQARIEAWCRNPDKLLEVGAMVLLSIRMQWVGVGRQMSSVRELGADSPSLWGFKKKGYLYLQEHRRELYRKVQDKRAGRITTHDLMREFVKVPGLGLPKAGFLVQLVTGTSGCLDMHNIERFGLSAKVWTIRKYRDPAKQLAEIDDKITVYLALIEACGGTEKLWDEWCDYLNDRVGTFESAEDVSVRHYVYLLGFKG